MKTTMKLGKSNSNVIAVKLWSLLPLNYKLTCGRPLWVRKVVFSAFAGRYCRCSHSRKALRKTSEGPFEPLTKIVDSRNESARSLLSSKAERPLHSGIVESRSWFIEVVFIFQAQEVFELQLRLQRPVPGQSLGSEPSTLRL